jgi:hypothetical protein
MASTNSNRLPLCKLKDDFICAEIGVWRGDFSHEILKFKPKELHLIDPWVHQEHQWVEWAKGQKVIDAHNHVIERFSNKENVFIHKKQSTEIFLGENYFDWVYIDADHSYDSVKKDLNHWFPQVKKGGFLCGDDYTWSHALTKGPGPAVDEFTELHNLKLEVLEDQYIIYN